MREGLRVDGCGACQGVWLDLGELYPFVKDPKRAYERVREAYRELEPCERACPRCREPLVRARLDPGNIEFEACPRCGGNWFDHGEVEGFATALSVTASLETGGLDAEKVALAAVAEYERGEASRAPTREEQFWAQQSAARRGEVLPAGMVRFAALVTAAIGLEEIVFAYGVMYVRYGAFSLPHRVEMIGLEARLHGVVLLAAGLYALFFWKRTPPGNQRRW